MNTDPEILVYIDSSTATHIKKRRENEKWLKIFRDSQANHCPFIVAIVSQNPKRISRAEDVQPDENESVVGFAFQKHYGDEDSKFDYTLKLEIWVSAFCLRCSSVKALGDCLVVSYVLLTLCYE